MFQGYAVYLHIRAGGRNLSGSVRFYLVCERLLRPDPNGLHVQHFRLSIAMHLRNTLLRTNLRRHISRRATCGCAGNMESHSICHGQRTSAGPRPVSGCQPSRTPGKRTALVVASIWWSSFRGTATGASHRFRSVFWSRPETGGQGVECR